MTIKSIIKRAHCVVDLDLTDSPIQTLGSLPNLPCLTSLNFSGCVGFSSVDFNQIAKRAPGLETFFIDATPKHSLCKDLKLSPGYVRQIAKKGLHLRRLSMTLGSKVSQNLFCVFFTHSILSRKMKAGVLSPLSSLAKLERFDE